MENTFSKKAQAVLQRPLQQRCEEFTKLIDESSTKELHNFFPDLLSSIFGYSNRPDWGLRTLTSNHREYDILRAFLGSHGPMFRLLNKLQLDGLFKYEFFIRLLPYPTRTSLSEGVIPALYHNKLPSPSAQNLRSSNGVILLDPYEYYMFHFAYYIIYQHSNKVQDSNWFNEADCPYTAILEDYLNYFLPLTGNLISSPLSSKSTMNMSRNTVWQGSNVYGIAPNPQSQFTGLIRTPSGHATSTTPGHTTYGHGSGEATRSESFLQILIEFWLNQNTMESVTSNVLTHGQQYFLPSVDLARVVRMFLKQVHAFVYSAGIESHAQPVSSPEDELKRSIIPQLLQKKLYCFLRLCFAHWPLDPSFRMVIEAWLSYIQPWRYAKQTTLNKSEQGQGDSFSSEWCFFVHENFLFYTALLREFVLRALKLDLFSVKDVIILFRGCKVLSQPGLMELVESDERLLQVPSGGAKGSLRGSSSSIGVSLGSVIRTHIAELEGPSYVYTPILQQPGIGQLEELRYLVRSALAEARKQQPGGRSDQHSGTNGDGVVTGWFKSIMSGDFLLDDSAARSEKHKLESFLQQILDNLGCIIGVNGDVTDAGENTTIPWATASPVSLGRPLTGVPITPGATLPEYEQTDEGLVLTERGKYQVIMGIRRPQIVYSGDPELQPIRSYENAALVRMLYRLSTKINAKLGDSLQHVYNNPGPLGNLACTMSPGLVTPSPRSSLGGSPRSQSPRRPHVSLRYLASYRNMFFLLLLYLLCWLFGLGSLTKFVLFVIVLVGSVIAHVTPAYERRRTDELQKKLF